MTSAWFACGRLAALGLLLAAAGACGGGGAPAGPGGAAKTGAPPAESLQTILQHADSSFRDGDYVEAQKAYEQALQADPGQSRATANLATCYLKNRATRKAQELLLGFLDRHPDVGLVGPQLLEPDGSVQLSCRRFSTPLTLVLRGLQLDRVVRAASVDRFLMKDVDHGRSLDVDWVFGAMMIARREAVAAVGGMDERYRVTHWEDEDWCCAMWRGGWRVCYVPAARAVHEHQQAGRRRPFGRMGRAKAINAVRMLVKFRGRLSRTAAGAGRPAS